MDAKAICKSIVCKKAEKDLEGSKTEVEEEDYESDISDILSFDSYDSELDDYRKLLEGNSIQVTNENTTEEDELQKMFFFSIYIDALPSKDSQLSEPQTSKSMYKEEFDKSTRQSVYKEADHFIIDETDEEKFNELLKSHIDESEAIADIEGNISIRTLTNRNFETLNMDGASRRVALVFSYRPADRPISYSFLHLMQQEKDRHGSIGGLLLYYPTDNLGIHIVEASEYVLLMHFPAFFKAECFKRIIKCKVLGVEDLSATKYFVQYACYKAAPPRKSVTKKREYSDKMKQMGEGLRVFMNHAVQDFPSMTEDNILPDWTARELPGPELLSYALSESWEPGLREVKQWYHHLLCTPPEVDGSEFVWPIRSDMAPVNTFHPEKGEEEMFEKNLKKKMKEHKEKETLTKIKTN